MWGKKNTIVERFESVEKAKQEIARRLRKAGVWWRTIEHQYEGNTWRFRLGDRELGLGEVEIRFKHTGTVIARYYRA